MIAVVVWIMLPLPVDVVLVGGGCGGEGSECRDLEGIGMVDSGKTVAAIVAGMVVDWFVTAAVVFVAVVVDEDDV